MLNKFTLLIAASLAAYTATTTPSSAAIKYRLSVADADTINSLNDKGQVTGRSALGTSFQATIKSGTRVRYLGTLGSKFSEGLGINSSDQVTGVSSTATAIPADHAFLYDKGKMKDLGTLGGKSSAGYDINTSGQMTGDASVAKSPLLEGATHAFIYSGGVMKDLGTLPGGKESHGVGINDAGEVTGYGSTPRNGPLHGFFYSQGKITDLGTLGGPSSLAHGLNNNGLIVGESDLPKANPRAQPNPHAFLYAQGVMKDLGTLGGPTSSADAINTAGDIVGTSTLADGVTSSAFLYTSGVMTDLNTLISHKSGLTLRACYSINTAGQILCVTDFISGENLGHVILTPVKGK